jgi:carboxyl-terminal processing protease
MLKRTLKYSPLFILLLLAVTTRYVGAEEKFGGIGIRVAQLLDPGAKNNAGSLVVLYVVDDGPASEAGIQKGDLITHIADAPTKGSKFEDLILTKLRGPVGSEVQLIIERHGIDKDLSFILKRTEIIFQDKVTE